MIVAVAVLSHDLHLIVLQVLGTVAEDGEVNTLLTAVFHDLLQFSFAGLSDVEVPVRGDQNPVYALFDEILLCHLIGIVQSESSPGSSAGTEQGFCQTFIDFILVFAAYAIQHHAVAGGIIDEGYRILLIELLQHIRIGAQRQRQLVDDHHGPGHIGHQHEVGVRLLINLIRPNSDPQKLMVSVPGADGVLCGNDKGFVLHPVCAVVKVEVIHHFFNLDLILIYLIPVQDIVFHLGVSRRIHVNGESGQGRCRDGFEGILPDLAVFRRIEASLLRRFDGLRHIRIFFQGTVLCSGLRRRCCHEIVQCHSCLCHRAA